MKKQGLIQIYTGDGRGKTTQAVGQAVRARGQGFKVCFIHFFKDPLKFPYGEDKILNRIGVKVLHYVHCHPHFYKGADKKKIRNECLKAMGKIRGMFRQGRFDMIILDELNIALRDGFLKEKEVMGLLKQKPAGLYLVCTGRGVSGTFFKCADLVSEVRKVKHPFDRGIKARKGIEY